MADHRYNGNAGLWRTSSQSYDTSNERYELLHLRCSTDLWHLKLSTKMFLGYCSLYCISFSMWSITWIGFTSCSSSFVCVYSYITFWIYASFNILFKWPMQMNYFCWFICWSMKVQLQKLIQICFLKNNSLGELINKFVRSKKFSLQTLYEANFLTTWSGFTNVSMEIAEVASYFSTFIWNLANCCFLKLKVNNFSGCGLW